jgi:hypothetical protein
MKFRVGRFTAEFKLGDNGQLQVLWSPYRPCYLNRGEREQYRSARTAFMESLELSGEGPPRNVVGGG